MMTQLLKQSETVAEIVRWWNLILIFRALVKPQLQMLERDITTIAAIAAQKVDSITKILTVYIVEK